MHYVGAIIQRVWTDDQAGRTPSSRHHRRPDTVPGAVRRRTSPARPRD